MACNVVVVDNKSFHHRLDYFEALLHPMLTRIILDSSHNHQTPSVLSTLLATNLMTPLQLMDLA
jgi:hypothetical protein